MNPLHPSALWCFMMFYGVFTGFYHPKHSFSLKKMGDSQKRVEMAWPSPLSSNDRGTTSGTINLCGPPTDHHVSSGKISPTPRKNKGPKKAWTFKTSLSLPSTSQGKPRGGRGRGWVARAFGSDWWTSFHDLSVDLTGVC